MTPEWALLNIDENVPKRAPSLADQTYEALKGWIVNGDLEPQTTLSENDLARRFAISRSPLREAIRQLQDEGLLEPSGPRGFSVPPLNVDLVRQVYGVRIALETEAAAHAHVPPNELDDMTARLELIDAAIRAGDLAPFNASDFAFHDLFIQHSGNALLIKHIHRLRGNVQRIINFAGAFPSHTESSFAEHLVIFDAMKRDDQKALTESVRTHIGNVTKRVIDRLNDQPG
jgi:DNA-binding GntR family transcriptional regulator